MSARPSKRGRVIEPRVCAECRRVWIQPEHGWDVSSTAGSEMVDTCSASCRQALGLPERQR